MRDQHVIPRQRRNRGFGPIRRHPIHMPRKHPRPHRIAGNRAGILGFGPQIGQNLTAHPLHRVTVEAGGYQRLPQQIDRGIAVFRQEPRPHRHPVQIAAKIELGRQPVARGGKALRIQIPGPLFDQRSHQIGRTPLVRRIQRRAALKPDRQRGKGDAVILHQPGRDPAGRSDNLNLRLGPDRQRQNRQRQHSESQPDHALAQPPGHA